MSKEFKQYSASFGADGTGQGITDRERTVQLVDVFYSLVTDIYEWCVCVCVSLYLCCCGWRGRGTRTSDVHGSWKPSLRELSLG